MEVLSTQTQTAVDPGPPDANDLSFVATVVDPGHLKQLKHTSARTVTVKHHQGSGKPPLEISVDLYGPLACDFPFAADSRVVVAGRLALRSWEGNGGNTFRKYFIRASSVTPLPTRS